MMGNNGKKAAAFILLAFLFFHCEALFAQSRSRASGWGDNYTIKIAVIGPGDELYFWWGHIGLLVEDLTNGQSRFFDWGVFDFHRENFFTNFALGRLIYTCAVTPSHYNINNYIHTNRDITLYTLNLDAKEKEAILLYATNNMLPENADYNYHHFDDNCATRVRDIIDLGLFGGFESEYGDEPGRYTLRQHVRRHTWFNPFFDWMLNFLMGQGIDEPITVWDEMFLPSEIGSRITDFTYTNANGEEKPLVSSIEVVNISQGRPLVLDVPRRQWPVELLVSLVFSAFLLLLFFLREKIKGFKIIMGLINVLLGLFFGIVGSVLFFMTFFSDHDYTYYNINVLFINPLLLAAVPLGILFAFSKVQKRAFIAGRLLRYLWAYVFLGGLLSIAVKISPAFYQQNQVDLALILPFALTMSVIFALLSRLRASSCS